MELHCVLEFVSYKMNELRFLAQEDDNSGFFAITADSWVLKIFADLNGDLVLVYIVNRQSFHPPKTFTNVIRDHQ